MLNQDKLIIKIGKNRSGNDAGEIDMEVAVQYVEDLCDHDFQQLLATLDAAKASCKQTRDIQ